MSRRGRQTYRHWTGEENDQLRRYSHLHWSPQQIADAMRRTVSSVKQHMGSLGLISRYFTKQEDALLRDMFGVVSNAEIAARLNRTPEAVTVRASTLKLPYRRKVRDYGSIPEITAEFKVPGPTIMRACRSGALKYWIGPRNGRNINYDELVRWLDKNPHLAQAPTRKREHWNWAHIEIDRIARRYTYETRGLTTPELAKAWRVSNRHIAEMAQKGMLPGARKIRGRMGESEWRFPHAIVRLRNGNRRE